MNKKEKKQKRLGGAGRGLRFADAMLMPSHAMPCHAIGKCM